MRLTGALSRAVLLALVLGLPACSDWVSSLSPFGIDTRDYSTEAGNVNGGWTGTTGSGGSVSFLVGNAALNQLLLEHRAPGCNIVFAGDTSFVPIVDGAFSFERDLDTQGRVTISGRFTSETTCSGSYSFRALPAGICPTSGSGTFVAEKKP